MTRRSEGFFQVRRSEHFHAPAVARWPSAGPLGPSRSGRRIGVEDPVVPNPTQHLGPGVREAIGEGDRVVASVEDEERHVTVTGQQVDQAA